MPLEELRADSSSMEDLTALAASQIRSLALSNCPVSDLSPLAGKPLEELFITGTKVQDLPPLAKCAKLKKLDIYKLPIDDITPLQNLRMEVPSIDYDAAKRREVLSKMPKLKTIGARPAAEVLLETEKDEKKRCAIPFGERIVRGSPAQSPRENRFYSAAGMFPALDRRFRAWRFAARHFSHFANQASISPRMAAV